MVQWMTLAVFTATIIAIVINKLDATVAVFDRRAFPRGIDP